MLDFKEYVKKPIPVKVCQLTEDLWNKLNSCVDNETRINEYTLQAKLENEVDKVFYVNTLEDVDKDKLHKAKINDYLIVGVKGEIYACDRDIFEKTYTLSDDYLTSTDLYQDACKLVYLSKELLLGGDDLTCCDCFETIKTQALQNYIDELFQEY